MDHLRAALAFGAIALGGTCLLSAYNRMLMPLLPIALLWLGYALARMPFGLCPAEGAPGMASGAWQRKESL